MVMPYHLHMPSYFLETFTEYPFLTFVLIEYQKESDSGVLPSLKNTFQCLTAFFDN